MAQTSSKPAWSRSEKSLIVVSAVVVALGIVFVTAIKHQNELPTIVIPNPKMPSPNAFDYFTKAGSAVVDSTKIGFAISTTHETPPSAPEDHVYTQVEKEALMSENASALKTLRQGFAYPYVNPPCRSFSTLFPYYAKERGLARLLRLEGQACAGRGDWAGAVSSDLDAVQIGTMVPHGSVLIGSLVGIACEAIGRKSTWESYAHLNVPQSRAASRRLERLMTQEAPFADTMQEEEWSIEAGLLEVLRAPNWSQEMASILSSSGGSYPDRVLEARLILTPKRSIIENYHQYMNRVVGIAQHSYAYEPRLPPIPSDPISQMLMIDFDQGRLKSVENQTQNALLTTTLALHAYHLAHGAYPANLVALVPGYLKAILMDPFARSGPLRYRLTGSSYMLYSVGPDANDDGGKAIIDPSKPAPTQPGASDPRHYVEQDSKGDIVAGVNIY